MKCNTKKVLIGGVLEIDFDSKENLSSFKRDEKFRAKSADRMGFEAEVDLIQKQIGDLEEIRARLGLSARKMTQLLMVDPSAWFRWTKKITPPPPHIYRALQWYLLLQEKNPGYTPQMFLSHRWHTNLKADYSKTIGDNQREDILQQISELNRRLELLEIQDNSISEKNLNFKNDSLTSTMPQGPSRETRLLIYFTLTVSFFLLGLFAGFLF